MWARTMWARVRGRTENALLKLPLKTFIFRPALVQPVRRSRLQAIALRADCSTVATSIG
jgi:hypothetical protein